MRLRLTITHYRPERNRVMAVKRIEFRDCPPMVCNHYDKGPSTQRVIAVRVRDIRKHTAKEYIVSHTNGKDYWREVSFGEWKIHKSHN